MLLLPKGRLARASATTVMCLALMLVHPPAASTATQLPVKNGNILFVGNGWVGGYPVGAYENVYLDIFSADAEGNVTRLTDTGVQRGAFSPSASPDGRLIAYSEWIYASVLGQGDIMLMRNDGSMRRPLLMGPEDLRDPAWSPDGTKLVFSNRSERKLQIFEFAGGRVTPIPLAQQFGTPIEPEWSPDGGLIAFTMQNAIWAVRPDGTGLRQLTGLPHLNEGHASWSPDGRWVAFTRQRAAEPGPAGLPPDHVASDIWMVSRDGRVERNLTDSPGTTYEEAPAWSPDGRSIAFVRGFSDRDNWDLWTMKTDGSGQRRIFGFAEKYAMTEQIYWLDWAPAPQK